MLIQQVPGPGEGVHRGLISRNEERHQFISQLPAIHAFPGFFVTRPHQHREKILLPRLGRTLVDAVVDEAVDGGQAPLETAIRGRRDEHRERDQVGGTPIDEADAKLKRLVNP